MKLFAVIGLVLLSSFVMAQQEGPVDTSWKKIYRGTATRINDLVHTKLEVKPDFSKSYLYGKAWITLHPHFYATDSLTLDAKGMEIKKVAIVKGTQQVPLKFTYDDFFLRIKLDRSYKQSEKYIIYIDYTAKPDEYQEKYAKGDLLGIKGMFFINPKGEEKDKPTQIWTQGETESNSAWFPTIDKTAQKTTEELTVTVENKYVTLSNGSLVAQKKNSDGSRTDTWKMDLPHSPYLFFLGVGEYAIVKDSWKGKEVNYYVEKEFAPVAKKIFGNTPEMIGLFSKLTGVDFPWVKYSQITGRDYVAGAMENTTATIHQETAQQDARQLLDGNIWESTIAHELFHQWFGDYVTAESWSNLTLNESFANFSEVLWDEYKYGKDAGAAQNYNDMMGYLNSNSGEKDLVRFEYADKEEMFDAVSYNKGGRILNMLRHELGDSAFYKALNLYLTTNKFKSAEAHQLRLAMEEVSGQDLNWYFNQWYFGNGNPDVDINYVYDDAAGKVKVIVKQKQGEKIFRLPLDVDIYNGAKKTRYKVYAENAIDTFTFNYSQHPDLVNVDGDKILLWTKKDNKTLDNYIAQYKNAGNFVDRLEALNFASKQQKDPKAVDLINTALSDPYFGIRVLAVNRIDTTNQEILKKVEPALVKIARSDVNRPTRGAALAMLSAYSKPEYIEILKQATKDSSYTVSGKALLGLAKLDFAAATVIAKDLAGKQEGLKYTLKDAVTSILVRSGDESYFDKALETFKAAPLQDKFNLVTNMTEFLSQMKNTAKFKIGVDELVSLKENVPAAIKGQTDPFLIAMLQNIAAKKSSDLKANPSDTNVQEQLNYVKSKLPEEAKKGF